MCIYVGRKEGRKEGEKEGRKRKKEGRKDDLNNKRIQIKNILFLL
jgi:hypothetical protein